MTGAGNDSRIGTAVAILSRRRSASARRRRLVRRVLSETFRAVTNIYIRTASASRRTRRNLTHAVRKVSARRSAASSGESLLRSGYRRRLGARRAWSSVKASRRSRSSPMSRLVRRPPVRDAPPVPAHILAQQPCVAEGRADLVADRHRDDERVGHAPTSLHLDVVSGEVSLDRSCCRSSDGLVASYGSQGPAPCRRRG